MRPKIRGKLIGAFAALLLVQLPAVATAQSSFSINDTTVEEGNIGNNLARFTVRRTGSDGSASVMCSAFGGTSTATGGRACGEGIDFLIKWERLTFAPGEAAKEFTIETCGDYKYEPNEIIYVVLEGATDGTIADDRGQATIIDNDMPEIDIVDVRVNEGNSGQTNVAVPVYLDNRIDQEVRIQYEVFTNSSHTATGGSSCGGTTDFIRYSGWQYHTFPPNTSSQTINLTVCGDTTVEPDDTFGVHVMAATENATVDNGWSTVTIVNDDTATIPTLSIGDFSYSEPDNSRGAGSVAIALMPLTISSPNHAGCTIDYTCVRGRATPSTSTSTCSTGSDYRCYSGTIAWPAGSGAGRAIQIPVCWDTLREGNETLTIQLSNPRGLSAPDLTATFTIRDND